MKTIYITAGHTIINGKGTGAISDYGDEAVEARKLVTDIARKLWSEHRIMTITDNDSWPLTKVIQFLVDRVTSGSLSIDIHFNAFANPSATGTEVIIPEQHTLDEKMAGSMLVNAISTALGIRKRSGTKTNIDGVKTESESQHATIGILRRPHLAKNILLEICFITNASDMSSYRSNYHSLVSHLSKAISKIA